MSPCLSECQLLNRSFNPPPPASPPAPSPPTHLPSNMSNEADYAVVDEDKMDEGNIQTRTMEIPVWLSTPEVTSE